MDIVEQVKANNRIEDVIEEYGFSLQRRAGRYIRGHEHDSLVVDTIRQVYHWHKENEIQQDVIGWVMNRKKVDFKSAVEELARRAHLPEPKWSREDQANRQLARAREDCWGIAQRMLAEFLWKDAAALAYCRGRGWTDATIRDAGLGFTGSEAQQAAALLS